MVDVTIVHGVPASALEIQINAMIDARGLSRQRYTLAQGIANINESTRLWIIFINNALNFYWWTTQLTQNGINQGIIFVNTGRFFEVQNMFGGGGSFANRPCTVLNANHQITQGIASPFNCTFSGIGWDAGFDGGQVPTLTLNTLVEVNQDAFRPNCAWLSIHEDPTVNTDNDRVVGIMVFNGATPIGDEYNIINNTISYCLGTANPPLVPTEDGLDLGIDLPFPFDGFEPLVNAIVGLVRGTFSLKIDFTSGILGIFEPLISFFTDPIGSVIIKLKELFASSKVESLDLSTNLIADLKSGSTPEMKGFEEEFNPMISESVDVLNKEVKPNVLPPATKSPEEAKDYLIKLAGVTHNVNLGLYGINSGIQAGSLGFLKFMNQLKPMVLNSFGYDEIVRSSAMIPIEKSVLKKAEYYYNSVFTPEIPNVSSLINMVVKEKIDLDDFKREMKWQGYSVEWSQLIWDAHFIAPSLGQLLVSYRRGHITSEELTALQILVDLDPKFNKIWLDQWFNDPTIRQGRYMFEAGAIDRAKVKDIIIRSGLDPIYVEPFTEYMITFNERQWKRRYILTLASGYRKGSIDEDELRKEVLSVYHSEGVANWIIKTEDFVKRTEVIKPKEEKVKLLSLGDLKKAYILDKIDADKLRSELSDMNYETESITILIEVLNESKIVQTEGRKIVSLTVAQYLQAWKQGVIDEDDVKARLFEKGLDMLEVTMIVETKKKQWKL